MAKAADAGLDRPIEAAVLKQARRIVADYQIVVINEDGEWYGHGLELPHVYGDGLSPGGAVRCGCERHQHGERAKHSHVVPPS